MSYSCPDFVDDIIRELDVSIDEDDRNNPQAQAELCLAAIAKLKRDTDALAEMQDITPIEYWPQRLLVSSP